MRHYASPKTNFKQSQTKRKRGTKKKLTGETFVKIRWKKQQKNQNEKNP